MSQTSTGDVSEPRRGTASSSGTSSGPSRPASPRASREAARQRGFFARIALFIRQVVAELRKVVRPTRNELITYTAVCMVFVIVVMAFVSGLDLGLGKVVLLVFGGSGSGS